MFHGDALWDVKHVKKLWECTCPDYGKDIPWIPLYANGTSEVSVSFLFAQSPLDSLYWVGMATGAGNRRDMWLSPSEGKDFCLLHTCHKNSQHKDAIRSALRDTLGGAGEVEFPLSQPSVFHWHCAFPQVRGCPQRLTSIFSMRRPCGDIVTSLTECYHPILGCLVQVLDFASSDPSSCSFCKPQMVTQVPGSSSLKCSQSQLIYLNTHFSS